MLKSNTNGLSNIISSLIICSTFLFLSLTMFYFGSSYIGVLQSNLKMESSINFLRNVRLQMNRLSFINDSITIFNSNYIIHFLEQGNITIFINDICIGVFPYGSMAIYTYYSSSPIHINDFIRFNDTCGLIFKSDNKIGFAPSISIVNFGSNFYMKFFIIRDFKCINRSFHILIKNISKNRYIIQCNGFLNVSVTGFYNISKNLNVYGTINLLFELVFFEVIPI